MQSIQWSIQASQQQHSEVCKQFQGAEITLHTSWFLLGVGVTIYTAHTLDKVKQLGINPQRSAKLARKLHAHSVQYAYKLTSTRHTIEIKNTQHYSGASGAACFQKPTRPTLASLLPSGEGDSRLFEPMCLLFLNWCRECSHCLFFLSYLKS